MSSDEKPKQPLCHLSLRLINALEEIKECGWCDHCTEVAAQALAGSKDDG